MSRKSRASGGGSGARLAAAVLRIFGCHSFKRLLELPLIRRSQGATPRFDAAYKVLADAKLARERMLRHIQNQPSETEPCRKFVIGFG